MENSQAIQDQLNEIKSMLTVQKTVLTLEDVAAYTGYKKSYIYRLSSNGGIPVYKPNGGALRFSKSEIDSWMLQNRKATKAELDIKASTLTTLKKGGK